MGVAIELISGSEHLFKARVVDSKISAVTGLPVEAAIDLTTWSVRLQLWFEKADGTFATTPELDQAMTNDPDQVANKGYAEYRLATGDLPDPHSSGSPRNAKVRVKATDSASKVHYSEDLPVVVEDP